VAGASVVKFSGTGLDQAELVFFVPMTWHRPGDTKPSTQFQVRKICWSPHLNGVYWFTFSFLIVHLSF
jgi:hypothetical protein